MNTNNHSARAEIRVATKELVDWLLSLNTNNRPVRARYVALLREEIKRGRWCITNQGIGVSEEMVLIDGQHRLIALRDCGYPPIPLLIVTGLPVEARLAVDQHAKRSARDILQFAFDLKVSRHAPALARAIYRNRNGWQGGPVTIHCILDIVEEHKDEIDALTRLRNMDKFPAGVHGAAVVAMKTSQEYSRVLEFLESVDSGEMLQRGMPAFCLRSFLLQSRGATSAGGNFARESFLKTLKAIESHLAGKELKVLRIDDYAQAAWAVRSAEKLIEAS